MDLFNKKSCHTMALMLNWPILLMAMGVWDSSHLGFRIAEPRNPALHQHEVSLVEPKSITSTLLDPLGSSSAATSNFPPSSTGHITPIDNIHTGAYDKSSVPGLWYPGQGNSGVFNTRDGLVVNRLTGEGTSKRRPMYQGVKGETRSRLFRSVWQKESARHDTHLVNPPPLDSHTGNLEGWSSLEDVSESGGWNAVEAQKSRGVPDDGFKPTETREKVSPEHEQALHHDIFQDDVFEDLPELLSIPPLNEHNRYPSSNAPMSPAPAKPYHAITTTGSPVTKMHEDTHLMSHPISSFPPPISVHSLGGALQKEHLQPNSLYERITGIQSDLQAHKVTEVLSHHDHIQNPQIFRNTPRTEFSQSSLDNHILDENLIRSPESHAGHTLGQSPNFENSPESQTFHDEPRSNSHDIPSPLHPLSSSSPFSNEDENFEQFFDYLTHATSHNTKPISPISERKEVPEQSSESSQESPITVDSLLHEFDSLPHLDDLPNSGEFSLDPHTVFSSPSEHRGVSSEKFHSFLDSEGWPTFKAASGIEMPDDSASSRLFEWKNDKVDLDRSNSDKQNSDEEKHMKTSQNQRPPSSGALISSSSSRKSKRPIQTHQVDFSPSKRRTPRDSSSIDEDDGSLSQAESFSTSKDTGLYTTDSSTLPSRQISWVRTKPRSDPGFASGTNSGYKRSGRNDETVSKNPVGFAMQHVKTKKKSRKDSFHPSKAEYTQQEVNLNFDENRGQQLISNSNHKPPLSRTLIDAYQPRIQEFMDSILKRESRREQSDHLIRNLKKLWDNYLEMIAICSELVSRKGVPTNLQEDLLDAYTWLSEKWVRIPETKFNWWPVIGTRFAPGKPHEEKAFSLKFEAFSVYDGTVYWLNHKVHNQRREHVATEYVIRFMRDHRKDWIKPLTPRRAERLTNRGLLGSMKRFRPLKYPGPIRSREPKPRSTSRKKRQRVL